MGLVLTHTHRRFGFPQERPEASLRWSLLWAPPLSLVLAPLPQEKSPLQALRPVLSGSGLRVLTHLSVSPRPTWWQLLSRAW